MFYTAHDMYLLKMVILPARYITDLTTTLRSPPKPLFLQQKLTQTKIIGTNIHMGLLYFLFFFRKFKLVLYEFSLYMNSPLYTKEKVTCIKTIAGKDMAIKKRVDPSSNRLSCNQDIETCPKVICFVPISCPPSHFDYLKVGHLTS